MAASDKARRAAFATAVAVAHVAVLYGLVTLAPAVTAGVAAGAVKATFIEATEPERDWQPPAAELSIPELNLAVPQVPKVQLPVETRAQTRAISAQAALPARPLVADATAPRLISAVEYVREPAPRYPPQSRRLREQGLVVLRVLIDEKGQAGHIAVESSSGYERLDRAAKEAVARAAFRPYVEDGLPRRALVLIPIEFALASSAV